MGHPLRRLQHLDVGPYKPTGIDRPGLVDVLCPPWHYWFLYALFVVSTFYVILRKLGLSNGAVFAVALALYFGEGLFGYVPWPGFHFLCRHSVFFAFGAWSGGDGIISNIGRAPTRKLVPLIALAVTLVIVDTLYGLKSERATVIMLFVPAFVVMAAVACLLQRYHALRIIEYLGRNTLPIYLAHVFGTAGVRIALNLAGVSERFVFIHLL